MMTKAAIIFIFSALLFVGPVFAQNSNNGGGATSEPPHRVQVNFNARYPDNAGSAQWEQTEKGYQASFNRNNQTVVSDFDQSGQWLGSRTKLRESDWPPDTRKYIDDNYQQYEYKDGYRIENEKGSRYEIDLRSQNQNYRLNFDKEGGFVKEQQVN